MTAERSRRLGSSVYCGSDSFRELYTANCRQREREEWGAAGVSEQLGGKVLKKPGK